MIKEIYSKPISQWLCVIILCFPWASLADELTVTEIAREGSGNYTKVIVVGNYAYAAPGSKGLDIIDISTPQTPTLVGNYSFEEVNGIAVNGNYAYVAATGLQIIDISNPNNPTLVGSYNISGEVNGVTVNGNYAYVVNGVLQSNDLRLDGALQIINVSSPNSPTNIGSHDTSGEAWNVTVNGSYAYVADGSTGLEIIDISNPNKPTLAKSYGISGYAEDVAVNGSYAYVAGWSSGLEIIDISSPNSPSNVGNYDTSGEAWNVVVNGNYAYVADGASGLQIINISSPNNPILAGHYDTAGEANDVAVNGNYAYVADGDNQLVILHISSKGSPVAQFTASPTQGVAPLLVNLDARQSSGGEGSIVKYKWIFSDGADKLEETNGLVNHTFTKAGDYTIHLIVTNDLELTGEATKTVNVTSSAAGEGSTPTSGAGSTVASQEGGSDSRAGGDDGGCTLGNTPSDPLFPLLVIVSLFYLYYRHCSTYDGYF